MQTIRKIARCGDFLCLYLHMSKKSSKFAAAIIITNPKNKDENKEFTSFKLYRNDVFSMQQIGFQPSVGSTEHPLWRAGF